jgi:magnesium transporter
LATSPATDPRTRGAPPARGERLLGKDSRIAQLRDALDQGTLRTAHRMVNTIHPAEIAFLLESLPPAKREIVWELVDPELEGDVLLELHEDVRAELIGGMDAEELVAATEGMEVDDLADLFADLPEAVTRQVLRSMDHQDRERLKSVLAYGEDTAGGLMNTDTVSVRPDVTLEVVLRYLRMRGELPERTDALYVVNRHDEYLGTLPLTKLLTDEPDRLVSEVMDSGVSGIDPVTAATEVAALFQSRDLVTAPVIGADGRLLGRITIDDVVDVIRGEAEHPLLGLAGLDEEEDVYAGVAKSTRRRAIWLGINLATAFLASAVVGQFEATIEKVVALAILMPIVASMGGIAGTQTVTLIIRALALGQVQKDSARWLLYKEVSVGALNGMLWAAVVGVVTWLWFGEWSIAVIIFLAMLINLVVAALSGVLIPLLLKRLKIDPALASGVILTTFTDVVGFAALLGLGAVFLT